MTKWWMIPLYGVLMMIAPSMSSAQDVAKGRVLFLRICAPCHGPNGDGNGPAAPALTVKASDLRTLSARYGNPLPQDRIARFIDGRADVLAHGPRDMPVWGEKVWEFPEGKGHDREVTPQVANLIAYLQSIQTLGHAASFQPQ